MHLSTTICISTVTVIYMLSNVLIYNYIYIRLIVVLLMSINTYQSSIITTSLEMKGASPTLMPFLCYLCAGRAQMAQEGY